MFKSSTFDTTLESATCHLNLEPNWPLIKIICDLVRQNEVSPKYAVGQIKKKMISQNPYTAQYALLVLESVVKNCGQPIHEEIANKINCESFAELVRSTTHQNVKDKMIELIQSWSYAFQFTYNLYYKYRCIKDTMNILKAEGYKFPEMKDVSYKLFASDVTPQRADGDLDHCSGSSSSVPKCGFGKKVRAFDSCYDQLKKTKSASAIDSNLAFNYNQKDGMNEKHLTLTQFQDEFMRCKPFQELKEMVEKQQKEIEKLKKTNDDQNVKILRMEKKLEEANKQRNEIELHQRVNDDFKEKFEDFNCSKFDLTLKINEKEFKVQKEVLATNSPLLAQIFRDNEDADTLELKDISENTFQQILNFMQLKQPPRPTANFTELYVASGRLQMKELMDMCAQKLMKKVTPENSFEMLSLCEKFPNDELRLKALEEYKKKY